MMLPKEDLDGAISHHFHLMKRSAVAATMAAALTFTGMTPAAFATDSDPVVIDVTTFGAQPNSRNDSAQAIQDAIAKAKEYKDSGRKIILNFPEGRYDIYPEHSAQRTLYVSNTVGDREQYKNKKIGILLEDLKNVTLEGNGSLLSSMER